MDKETKKKIFLKKGELRKQVWEKLDEPKTATEIAGEIQKHRSAISRVLIEMEKKGMVKCLNPEDNSFKHYQKK